MPDAKYTGSPSGEGNPPGKYSKGYLGSKGSKGHFVSDKAYRGGMNVGGIKAKAPVVGLSSKVEGHDDLSSHPGNDNPIHQA